jgi:hypothetical protein
MLLPILIWLLFFGLSRGGVSITTWQADNEHTGHNLHESQLTPQKVASPKDFGFVFSQLLDGQAYAQPLLASGVKIDGVWHDIVYIATEHDSVYAFDANDAAGNGARPLWHDALLPVGTRPVPQSVFGSSDISVELGITATPVIDLASQTIYVVSKIQTIESKSVQQYLHALDLSTGVEKFGGPVLINPTFAGSASDGRNGVIPFNALRENSRAALVLDQGMVYIAFGSLSDGLPYHGEVLGYDAKTLQLAKAFIASPNGKDPGCGIWQAGAGPAIDAQGNMFVATSNGLWDQAASPYTKGTNWGESVLRLPTAAGAPFDVAFSDPSAWFTPSNWEDLNRDDLDLGSSGLLILPDQPGAEHSHLLVGGGKGGVLYVLNRDDLGGLHRQDRAVQKIGEMRGNALFATAAFYNGYIYYAAAEGPLEQRRVGYDAGTGNYVSEVPIISSSIYGGKGAGVFISANGTIDGIVWLLTGTGIDAYDAANVSGAPIFSAKATAPPGIICRTTKFSLPIVANGKVYFTGFDAANTGHLFVLGILKSLSAPAVPTDLAAVGSSSRQVTLHWTDLSSGSAGYTISRATSIDGSFETVGTVGANIRSFTDTGLQADTAYFYKVSTFNSSGQSASSAVISAATFPYVTSAGLIAFWNMDEENSGTVPDVTGNGHNGSVKGEVIPSTGFINTAYTFHGAGVSEAHIVIPNQSALQFGTHQSFTLAAWIKPLHLRNSEEAVLAKSADQGNAYGIWIDARNHWVFRGPKGDLEGPSAAEGAWTHVAVVQEAATNSRKMYVNGALVPTVAGLQPADGPGDLWMGQQNVPHHPESFPGIIDEVRLYARALSAVEITAMLGRPCSKLASSNPMSAGIRVKSASGPPRLLRDQPYRRCYRAIAALSSNSHLQFSPPKQS